MECRIRDLNYAGSVVVDVVVKYDNRQYGFEKVVKDINIGKFPVMVGSRYCWTSEMSAAEKESILECS